MSPARGDQTGRLLLKAHAHALKRATAAAITAIGDAEKAAGCTRVSARDLRKCASHEGADALRFISLDVAADLDLGAREPIIARALAQLNACTVVRVDADPEARALNALKETGEAVSAIAGLVSGGAWGRAAAKVALDDVRESIAALAALELDLRERVEGRA